MKTQKDLRPLIDMDLIRYRAGFAADSQVKKDLREKNPGISDEELGVAMAQLDYTALALHNVKTVLETIISRCHPDYTAYVQGKGNFRFELATLKPYKGNRNAEHKPKYYKEIKEYMVERWGALPVDDVETDDALAIHQYKNPDRSTVICSSDKDMRICPGWIYDWTKDRLFYNSTNEADLFLFWQMLVGDTSDNIPGINRIGEQRATKLLNENNRDLDKVREAVKKLYQNQYGENWEAAYHEVGTLLYILRKEDHHPAKDGCPLL